MMAQWKIYTILVTHRIVHTDVQKGQTWESQSLTYEESIGHYVEGYFLISVNLN